MSQAQDSHCNQQPFDLFVPNSCAGPTEYQPTFMQDTNSVLTYGQVNQAPTNTSACLFPQNENSSFPPQTEQTTNLCQQSQLLPQDFLCPNPCSQNAGSQLSTQQALSINAMTQMSSNELLWVIDPGTFES